MVTPKRDLPPVDGYLCTCTQAVGRKQVEVSLKPWRSQGRTWEIRAPLGDEKSLTLGRLRAGEQKQSLCVQSTVCGSGTVRGRVFVRLVFVGAPAKVLKTAGGRVARKTAGGNQPSVSRRYGLP